MTAVAGASAQSAWKLGYGTHRPLGPVGSEPGERPHLSRVWRVADQGLAAPTQPQRPYMELGMEFDAYL